ncbi:batten's disease protein Cln3 [Polychaeton citri CBS 116435]|uniref:Protein BTN n=1 Tax=Polychaeton citri CBS 116435 TaxID=1314669 RepID=A0A9P4Q1A6_9PEZI|nr:batten's disease protein Cln3 [Polychaeton citri CBS 116435]
MPGAPGSSWPLLKQRLMSKLEGVDVSIVSAFWMFGLINNVLYVVILTASLDLVGPSVPKGTVLLADVIPSFLVKLTAPYYIHNITYNVRILLFCALSAGGMLLIALSPDSTAAGTIITKMIGVVLASLSSGGGELSFLGLTHFYGPLSLAAWGSGTGGAGLIGAGAYAIATVTFGWSVRGTLLASALLPIIMLVSFFIVLPKGPLRTARMHEVDQRQAHAEEEDEEDENEAPETAGLLSRPPDDGQVVSTATQRYATKATRKAKRALNDFQAKLHRAKSLILPYVRFHTSPFTAPNNSMLPLFLVYLAEYTINQGVAPTLLFYLPTSPFNHYRAFYPTYNAIYQVGVFISRSSLPFIRVKTLYTPTFLQILNLAALTLHALFPYIPNVWFVFGIIFWEGLLGGLVYVSTFAAIGEEVEEDDREFSLGATTVSDSAGICVAGFLGMAMEVWLCRWQVGHGRDWCTRE